MSKFYGTVVGSMNEATRTGGRFIRAAAQSWDGSVITELSYNDAGELVVDVGVYHGSGANWAYKIFSGTFDEFVKKLEA